MTHCDTPWNAVEHRSTRIRRIPAWPRPSRAGSHPPAWPALACGALMKSPRRTASKPSPKRVQTRPNHVHSARLVQASVLLSKSHLARSHVPTHLIGASLVPLNTKPDFSRSRIEGPPTRILIDVNPPARDSHDDATREREAQAGHDFQKKNIYRLYQPV